MKGLSRVVLGSVASAFLGAASFFAVDGLMPASTKANPYGTGYDQNDSPYGPGYVQNDSPYSSGYVQDDSPYGPGYVQDKSKFGL